jgi:hypothetical protein
MTARSFARTLSSRRPARWNARFSTRTRIRLATTAADWIEAWLSAPELRHGQHDHVGHAGPHGADDQPSTILTFSLLIKPSGRADSVGRKSRGLGPAAARTAPAAPNDGADFGVP